MVGLYYYFACYLTYRWKVETGRFILVSADYVNFEIDFATYYEFVINIDTNCLKDIDFV